MLKICSKQLSCIQFHILNYRHHVVFYSYFFNDFYFFYYSHVVFEILRTYSSHNWNFFCFCFRLHLQHMEVPGPQLRPTPQLHQCWSFTHCATVGIPPNWKFVSPNLHHSIPLSPEPLRNIIQFSVSITEVLYFMLVFWWLFGVSLSFEISILGCSITLDQIGGTCIWSLVPQGPLYFRVSFRKFSNSLLVPGSHQAGSDKWAGRPEPRSHIESSA